MYVFPHTQISRRLNFSIRERDFFYRRKNFWHLGGKKKSRGGSTFLFAKEIFSIGERTFGTSAEKKNLTVCKIRLIPKANVNKK